MSLLDTDTHQEQQERFPPKMKVGEINAQVSWIVTHKRPEELADLDVLTRHKSVSVRRKVAGAYRQLGEEKHIPLLQEWLGRESDRETYVGIETALDAIARRAKGETTEFDASVLTVAEALSKIKTVLGEKTYILEGEVTEAKNFYQMYYFTIKDPESQATLNCRCYQNVVFNAGFPLNEGLQVRLRGKFVLDKYSRLLFDTKQLQLTGEGELARNLALLREKLEGEGLTDSSRKRPLPRLPKNILLLASSSSAALTDFTKVLGRRRGGMTVYHLPIKTQGVGAEAEILLRLRQANGLVERLDIDTIVLTRGGGSKEDLIVFNREAVVRAVHALARPTVVAIGHERDTSLAELVADVRASTPSQAAELASASSFEILQEKNLYVGQIQRLLRERAGAYRTVGERLYLIIHEQVRREIEQVRAQVRAVDRTVQQLLRAVYLQTATLSEACRNLVSQQIIATRQELLWIPYAYTRQQTLLQQRRLEVRGVERDVYGLFGQYFAQIRQELRHDVETIRTLHPRSVLEKGYALVEQDGVQINSPEQVEARQDLQIIFAKGTLKVRAVSKSE